MPQRRPPSEERAGRPRAAADRSPRSGAAAEAAGAAGHGRGEIKGAFGHIRVDDRDERRTWRHRLLTLAAIMGPGLIVMVGDNDAGGIATYAAAGQNEGYSLLWVLPLLVPVLVVNQEMAVRLGAVTGVGHAKLVFERFGRTWGWFSAGGLFVLNFLTIVTEFVGISLAGQYFGLSPYVVVPAAAIGLVGITASGNFQRWERAMFGLLFGSLLVIPIAALSHPDGLSTLHGLAVPGIRSGFTSDSVLLVIAIVGTTVTPWQLFFQQSNCVDKHITPRWMGYEKADTVIGAFVVVVSAAAITAAAAAAFAGQPESGAFTDALGAARGLGHHVAPIAGAMFAVLLLDASIIGASAVTLSTSYAFGDTFGISHSLDRGIGEAKLFYGTFTGLVVLAAAVVLLPSAPLGLITTAVQALAGILLPMATVFLLTLCNDREVLGPWANRPWLNAIAVVIVGGLVELSAVLLVSTVFPEANVITLLEVLTSAFAAVLVIAGAVYLVRLRRARSAPAPVYRNADDWMMPSAVLLQRPRWSIGRRLGMGALQGYTVVAVILLAVKAYRLATGTG